MAFLGPQLVESVDTETGCKGPTVYVDLFCLQLFKLFILKILTVYFTDQMPHENDEKSGKQQILSSMVKN